VEQILLNYLHDNCHPVSTPLQSQIVSEVPGETIGVGAEEYQSLLALFQYLVSSCRPDICFATNVLSQIISTPNNEHLTAALRVLKYLRGTARAGTKINSNNSSH
jgi:hypothetical protein